jgi:hypothetical protein
MPKKEDELMDMFRKAKKSGKDLDAGIYREFPEGPNEELNSALGFPKGTIVKPVPFPKTDIDPNKEVDIGGMKFKPSEMRPQKVTKDGLELLKKGGAIDLSQCKVNTVKKNSSSSKW